MSAFTGARRTFGHRAAALGLLGVLLGGLYVGVAAPALTRIEENRESRQEMRRLLDRYHEASQELPQLKTRLAELAERGARQSGLLTEENGTLAAAAIQTRIKTAVGNTGGQLHSMESLPVNKEGHLQKIAVRAGITVGLGGLLEVFQALNETAPVLLFESFEVRAGDGRGPAQTDADRLDVEFVVFGYLGDSK